MQQDDIDNRILMNRITWFNTPILVVNVYAPPNTPQERELFFTQLHQKLSYETSPIIMAGDFNCYLHPLDHHSELDFNHSTDQFTLTSLLNSLNLKDVWREYCSTSRRRTYGPPVSKNFT